MTWFEQVEQKRTLLIGGVAAICIAALAVTARRKPISFDSYWHVQTGLDWIYRGLSPWIDHFSFTYAGKAIGGQPFIFQALLAWLVNNFGLEPGYQIYKAAGFLLAFSVLALFLRRLRSPAIIYCMVLPLFVLLIELRSTVRPELLSYSLCIIAVMLYHRALGAMTVSHMLPIALLLLFWTNYHTPILGYIIFFGFFVDSAVLQLKARADRNIWIKWLLWGLIVLGVGYLHKGFHHPIISAFYFSPDWKGHIQEYQPATLYRGVIAVYALIIVATTTIFLAAWKQKLGYLIVTLILTYYAVQMSRLVAPCGIIILCIFASLISEIDMKKAIQQQGLFARTITGLGVLFVVLAALYSSITFARNMMTENRTSALLRPELIVEYMKEKQLSGRIYNEFGIGGYLIYALSPDSTVYIDGRTNILYPLKHYERFLDARNNPSVLKEEIEKYDINLAILETDLRVYTVMQEAGLLGLDFADQKFSLFTRENPNFPLTGKLLGNPVCWNEGDAEPLEAEFAKAMEILPAISSLIPQLAMMVNYSRAADKRGFLRKFEESSIDDEQQIRFAAYQALSLGLYQESANLFERIKYWNYREFLGAAMAYVQLEQWQKAELVVDSQTMILWGNVTPNDLILQYRILETIRRNHSLEHVPDSYVDDLKKQVENLSESADSLDLDVGLLCAY